MAIKGAGGNPGAITKKGGDDAKGSTGTGRGGGTSGGGTTARGAKKNPQDNAKNEEGQAG
ncbi:hypothetical protein H5J25_14520 [Sphingomonas aliaeris]|uniref:Uncharacterized protein n=1 Tax=Sphingomonas aliaeris TaxID=2759526 RepID=A0A974NTI1_9SPHN|nr:hypothetical protein [Sphingomonas aliaeris]QQV76637.1 hypothetical protein H5J25_14520 [Sphingomonas aliaeris]